MRKHIFLLILMVALVCPAFANDYTYTAPTNQAVQFFEFACDEGTTGTYTLTYQNGQTISGTFSYLPKSGTVPMRTAAISIGGSSETYDYITMGQLLFIVSSSGRVLNSTNTISISAGQFIGAWNIKAKVDGENSPIISYTLSADTDIAEPYTKTEDIKTVTENLQQRSLDDWISNVFNLITNSFWAAYTFIGDLIYWIKYFFIDNLAMLVALFLAVPMAFAAKNSRGNPERFLRQYFKTLRGFFDFILSLWRMLLESIGTIRGWFRV